MSHEMIPLVLWKLCQVSLSMNDDKETYLDTVVCLRYRKYTIMAAMIASVKITTAIADVNDAYYLVFILR